MTTHTLIVGAGPFGLGLAAYLQQRGQDYCIVGKPLEFWEKHMPPGMLLRSPANWYLDADHHWTIERFFAEEQPAHPERPGRSDCQAWPGRITAVAGKPRTATDQPISREHYLQYMRWFMQRAGISVRNQYVRLLTQTEGGLRAELDNGETIDACNVVLATGFQYFAAYPDALVAKFPAGRYRHTCDAVSMDAYRGRRVLLIGGRQSAFEWAALLREAGAAHVHLSYRHDTPAFAEADWSWVETIVANMADQPGWFRELSATEQNDYRYRLWAEGRLKVEPWLEKRVNQPNVTLHPRTELASATRQPDDALRIALTDGAVLAVDEVVLATGYQVDVSRLPFLSASLLGALALENGFPRLDLSFQSNVPGLYFSSFPAGQSFGPFFGFTVAVRMAATLIGGMLCGSGRAVYSGKQLPKQRKSQTY